VSKPIQESKVREQLAKILASKPFVNSPKISKFLSFIVEETLNGRKQRIKAFTIAQEVFGRDEKFDQQRDTIVRVEAGRLRRRLSNYYSEAGRQDDIVIMVPKGGYAPEFSQLDYSRVSPRALKVFLFAVSLLFLSTVAWWLKGDFGNRKVAQLGQSPAGELYSKPFVAIMPIEGFSPGSKEATLMDELAESLINTLAKVSGLSVMAHASVQEISGESYSIESLKQDYDVSHVLQGRIETQIDFSLLHVTLIEIESKKIIWSDQIQVGLDQLTFLRDQLTEQVTNALAIAVLPDEQQNLLRTYSENAEALAFYKQAWILLISPHDSSRIVMARDLFRRSRILDPGFAGGPAGEGFTHAIACLFLQTPDQRKEIETALELSRISIEQDPTFGMGWVTLGFAHAVTGRRYEGIRNAEFGVGLLPGDAWAQFIYGLTLVIAGFPDDAIGPLNKALRLNPIESRTPYLNVLGIAQFAAGEYEAAMRFFDTNQERGGPSGPHMGIFRAAALVSLGEHEEARVLVETLSNTYPDFQYEGGSGNGWLTMKSWTS